LHLVFIVSFKKEGRLSARIILSAWNVHGCLSWSCYSIETGGLRGSGAMLPPSFV